MRKFLIVFLAVFYLGAASGMSLQFHYCMGRLVEWGFQTNKAGHCGNCGMKKAAAKKCCKSSQTELKVEKSHKVAANDISLQLAPTLVPEMQHVHWAKQLHRGLQTAGIPLSNAPPDKGAAPVFLLYCNFRI